MKIEEGLSPIAGFGVKKNREDTMMKRLKMTMLALAAVLLGICSVAMAAEDYEFVWKVPPSYDYSFLSLISVAVDVAGNVFVADQSNHSIQKFTSEGIF